MLDVTNFQPNLHPSDPRCVDSGGQLCLLHIPEQRAAVGRRGGPTHQFSTRTENAIEVLLFGIDQVRAWGKLSESLKEERRHG